MNENPEISGLLYKKRGGFGKIMPNAWQFRYFSISKEGLLTYVDTDSPEVVRGKLDLKGSYEMILDLPIEGAPTNYCIQFIPPNNEERWKLCADTKEDHTRWCKVLERFMAEKGAHASISCISDDENEVKKGDRAATPTFGKKELNAPKLNTPTHLSKAHTVSNFSVPPSPIATHVTAPAPSPAVTATSAAAHTAPPVVKPKSATAAGGKKRLKLGNKSSMISAESMEGLLVLIIVNIAFYVVQTSSPLYRKATFVAIANFVVLRTLQLRAGRANAVPAVATAVENNTAVAEVKTDSHHTSKPVTDKASDVRAVVESRPAAPAAAAAGGHVAVPHHAVVPASGKPIPGFTFTQVHSEPRLSPPHTWCRVDHRQFNVRVGPDYNRYKKKAPSGTPIYEPFAVDVFCTKQRVDHAATRFQLPDTSHINTHNPHVPPIIILQIQIPSEPPTSIFSSAEDGPGWAIVMYYRITEDSCNQLKDLSTAAPHIKLFAEWCEKAPVDAAWRGRFKVINSCTNLEELGMPSAIVSYNAKPVLIRRTGTIFKGPNYLEMNIHVHKFANLAKQSIYLISSRCGLMFMQIGFVIEGREDKELPETMFACVAVNKPQEDQAEFIFEDDEA